MRIWSSLIWFGIWRLLNYKCTTRTRQSEKERKGKSEEVLEEVMGQQSLHGLPEQSKESKVVLLFKIWNVH